MKDLSGTSAIVTGASKGIGAVIARALAARGVRVALVARSEQALEAVRLEITARGGEAIAIPADVTSAEDQARLVERTLSAFGAIHWLVNNAGAVTPSAYERLPPAEIERVLALNLTAPMTLTRRVLPVMLEQQRGHIVNVASLGGLIGIGWGESYSASKHGLVGFTRSLRTSLAARGSSVSASVVCPGFVDDVGMYDDEASSRGIEAPWALGTSAASEVADAVLRAIDRNLLEVVVSPRPIRLLLMLAAASPRLGEWLVRRLGGHRVFEGVARANGVE
ncbi:SDR family NAD(P)-dependent oxidoreductase [Paraliomyxa miuraensis]|uniref:SDR family NAD(P)-dependent oxidoreductase n=1 Tax=Paraliomyxa miuraensis TaxID=376150 RepID=UPI00224CEB3F|nr:SDR family oxidoreductase [Paraliomyxa miuraensis]